MARGKVDAEREAAAVLDGWLAESQRGSRPAPLNVISAGLVLTELLRERFPLLEEDYSTEGAQIREIKSVVKRVMARHGEEREYSSESGRTSRSTLAHAKRLADRLNRLRTLEETDPETRRQVAEALQVPLVKKISEHLDRKGIDVDLPGELSVTEVVGAILQAAGRIQATGPVAQHLVAAKLAIRFPDMKIPNYSANTADKHLRRKGDIEVGDAVFHVTFAPSESVLKKCKENRRSGVNPMLLVPESKVAVARQIAENVGVAKRLDIASVEQFVSQNINELAEFEKGRVPGQFRRLIAEYNIRIQIEKNPGLAIICG